MTQVPLTRRLSTILHDSVSSAPRKMGSAAGPRQKANAIADRMAIEASNMTKMFYAALSMILAAFLVMLFLLIVNASNPAAFTAISGASGLTLGGLIWFALRTAREAAQAALLTVLVANLPSDKALAAIEALLKDRGPLPTGTGTDRMEERT